MLNSQVAYHITHENNQIVSNIIIKSMPSIETNSIINCYGAFTRQVIILASLAVCRSAVIPLTPGHPFIGVTATQFHAQDELGQASFGYSHPGQAATTFRDAFGNQVGSWAYINPEGKEVRVSFVADANGFRVLSNDLPVAPLAVQDTAEVAAAKAAHFEALAEAGVLHVAPQPVPVAAPAVVKEIPVPAPAVVHTLPVVPHAIPVAPHSVPVVQAIPVAHHSVPVVHHSAPVVPHFLAQAAPVIHATPAFVPSTTVTKYHSQDELGQASFGHATADQTHNAVRDAFGNQVGSYSYINPEGKEVRVHYTAGVGGFRVISNALPEAPSSAVPLASSIIKENPDVVAARVAFFKTFDEAKNRIKH